MLKAAEIGRRFIDFFAAHDHTVVPSASLLLNDPTLLFVNAGMVPFKNDFLDVAASPYKRAVSLQKCVRTLDIDDVGKTTRHGTFFQMLGNFAFGDYFKKEAIEWAWQLVTNSQVDGGFGFDPAKIWVTVLGPGLHPDLPDGDVEARRHWLSVGVPADHIQPRGLKDNYWSMGVPGPGGPCSEIYIDRGPEFGPDGGPDVDEDRFLEIWNLVFQQEDLSAVRAKDDFDVAGALPTKNIDTGAGLERIAYLLQGVANMYEIDDVFPVIAHAAELTGKRYGADPSDDIRFRVVADHVRSGLMLMNDGITPGNEARGYVLRRLLRRAVRSMRLLGHDAASLVELLDVSRQVMSVSYPEIDEQWPRIADVAAAEEQSFTRTLSQGTSLFDTAARQTKTSGSRVLSGEKAFQLHDTYGFPIDLTLEMAADQGLEVDLEAFRSLMAEQRQRAKADAQARKGGLIDLEPYHVLRSAGETPFVGFDDLELETRVIGLVVDGQSVSVAHDQQSAEIVLAATPFYAEMGGQAADKGVLVSPAAELKVLDVQRPVPGLIVHKVTLTGELAIGDPIIARVDAANRLGAAQAHTATHIIHAALRELVGRNATQAGSFNRPGYLRFDFASTKALSGELKIEIEQRANQAIRDDLVVTDTQMPLEEAKAIGAMAMFGEKYPPIVRMVELGGPWSRELCGGTHVASTARIGMLTLLGEQSIGSGTRRIEALVSSDAFNHMAAERALVSQLTGLLKVSPEQLPERVSSLVNDLKMASRTIEEMRLDGFRSALATTTWREVNGVRLLARVLDGAQASDLRSLATDARQSCGNQPGVVVLIAKGDKPSVIVTTNQQARDRGIRAGEIVGVAAGVLGGRGGGKDDMAQGGGTDPTLAAAALEAALQAVESRIE